MCVLGMTEHRSLVPGGKHLYPWSHLTGHPHFLIKRHSFIYPFNRNLTDHLLCAKPALDARTRESTVQRTNLPTYII